MVHSEQKTTFFARSILKRRHQGQEKLYTCFAAPYILALSMLRDAECFNSIFRRILSD